MNESEFNRLADQAMVDIEEAIEASGADIDYDTISEILTLEFENGSKIIINKQTPLSQLWVAAQSGGFHFDFNSEKQAWYLDSDSSKDLFTCLSEYCTQQSGEPVELSA
jgi:CyaY protein